MFTADKGWPNEIELEIVTNLTHRVITFREFVASTEKYNIGGIERCFGQRSTRKSRQTSSHNDEFGRQVH